MKRLHLFVMVLLASLFLATSGTYSPPRFYWRFAVWGGRWDLNPRHSEPQSDALPAELLPPYGITPSYAKCAAAKSAL